MLGVASLHELLYISCARFAKTQTIWHSASRAWFATIREPADLRARERYTPSTALCALITSEKYF